MHCVCNAYLIYWEQTGGGIMAHSIYDYLSRQSTEKLRHILKLYIGDEQSELNNEIIRLVTKVLNERATGLDLHSLSITESE